MNKTQSAINQTFDDISFEILNLETEHSWYKFYLKQQKPRIKRDLNVVLDLYRQSNTNKQNFKILDVGSNPPFLVSALSKNGFNVTGIDCNPRAFAKTIEKFSLNVCQCDIESQKLPFDDNSFDLITFAEVFEHLRIDPIFTVSELYRVLKKDGLLLLETPNLYSLKGIYSFLLKGKAYACSTNNIFDKFQLVHKFGFFGHIREYSFQEVEVFLNKIGFNNTEVLFSGGGKKLITKPVYTLFKHLRPSMMFVATK